MLSSPIGFSWMLHPINSTPQFVWGRTWMHWSRVYMPLQFSICLASQKENYTDAMLRPKLFLAWPVVVIFPMVWHCKKGVKFWAQKRTKIQTQWLEGKLLELEVLVLEGHEAISPEEQLEVSRREVAVFEGQGWVFCGHVWIQSHHKHV